MKLADRVGGLSPSLTLAITAKVKKMRKEGIDVVSFGAGEPDYDTPEHIKKAAIEAIECGFTKYTPASGMPELREAIAAKLKRENALEYDASSIVVSCGAKHTLYSIFQVIAQADDEVIIPAPYWLSYPEMVKMSGAKPVIVDADESNGFKMDPEALKKAITKRAKAIIINSPSNPTGAAYTTDELARIADVAVSSKALVISDEIYEKLLYDGLKHTSIASLGKEIKDLSLVVNGVSKSYSMTGWRIGYVAGPVEIIKAMSMAQSHSTSNPASISQKAALEAISGDQSSVEEMRAAFEGRRDYLLERLSAIKGFVPIKPEGAFYVFCNISGTGLDSVTLANQLLDEAKVAVVPGKPFGSDMHIRFSFAISKDEIKEGMDRVAKWAAQRR